MKKNYNRNFIQSCDRLTQMSRMGLYKNNLLIITYKYIKNMLKV